MFKREVRYDVTKLSSGKKVDCVVIESDWPEYETVWKMLQDRVEGRPNKIERLNAELAEEHENHAQLQSRCFDQGGNSVFDEVRILRQELAELRAYKEACEKQEPVGEVGVDGISIYGAYGEIYDSAVESVQFGAKLFTHPAPIPEGMMLVPIEPTEQMIRVGCMNSADFEFGSYEEWADGHSSGMVDRVRRIIISDYKAMLAAAKKGGV